MYIGLRVNILYSRYILMKLEFSRQIFEKFSNINFNNNPSSGSPVVPCGQTDGRRDKKKLTVASRNFVNESKNYNNFS